MGDGLEERGSAAAAAVAVVAERGRPTEWERERATHPLSHVFDRGVFPTGVKKGRADWAE